MAQRPQIVDITKSYLPGDPNAFVQNLVNTDREDGEEKTLPLVPYEGYNFLPTSYGYKSFFGTNAQFGISALSSRVQHVLLYQIPTYKSRLIALCEDGIWVCTADGQRTNWIQVVTHTFDADVFEEWTWCVIENVLYMYKQGTAQVYKTEIGAWTIVGELVSAPALNQTFDVVEGSATGTLPSGDMDTLSVLYYQTTTGNYSPSSVVWAADAINANRDLTVTVTGTLPAAASTEYLLYYYDDGSGIEYVKQFATLSSELIEDLTGWVALAVPSDAQGFAVSDTAAGDGTFDTDPFVVSVQYVKGPVQYAVSIEVIDTTTPGTNTDITITITGASPGVGTSLRVWLENDNTGDTYYKDVALSGSAAILSLTECTQVTGTDPQRLLTDDVVLTNDLTITSFVPSFLNMAGQLGIFKAGLRLGMWDSANSVSWSSNLDLTDFTPSIENLAGNTIFGSVVGRIVHCRGHGEGFIVYSTKSIVGATFSASGNLLWDAKKILDNTGISFSRAVSTGKTDSEHFVFATTGIYALGKYNPLAGKYEAEPIIPEIYDFLKESRDPVYLTVLQDRYLCFSLIADTYLYGKQSFSTGWANPYVAVVDWYVPSVDYPAPTEFLLPEQIYEIIRDEMSGSSRTKRKDGEWIPRYTTTVDIMDDRYYSFGRSWIGDDITGKVRYSAYSTYFDSLPVNLTAGDITTYLNPQRPVSPPDASRYGILKTSTDMRAFCNLMGVDPRANNEALIYLQESEWEYFKIHQRANRDRLEAYTGEVITPIAALSFSVNVVGSTATTGAAAVNNITWTLSLDSIQVATGAASFTLSGSNPRTWSLVNWPSFIPFTGVWGDAWWPTFSALFPLPDARYYVFNGQTIYGAGHSTNPWQAVDSSGTWTFVPTTGTASADTVIGTLVTGEGNNEWLTTEGPSDKAAKEVILRRTFNKGFEVTKHVDTVINSTSKTAITTYITEEVTGTYGYSQFRALVTWWDRIRFGLYGDYEILESVAAEAMTPKIWEGIYPSDLGSGRDQLWSYGQYKAIRPVDLASGKIGSQYIAANDPDGTALVATTGFSTEGITSLHTSFTLPGASFLLQTGSIEASYPTFVGALVLDMHLKKWGKYKGDHKVLLETTPINTASFGNITYTDLGANAGIIDSSGLIFLFDSVPLDSWIRWGKIGYYRQGFSNLLEVRASMRNPSDFVVITESSMDGKLLDLNKNTYTFYYDEVVAESYMDISARWHTVKIAGNFDLTGLEVRATLAGRR